jgi:RNA polymerase sigma-70 factor (ECF subfamily)
LARLGAARRQSAADEALVRWVFEEHGRALWAYATRLLGDRQAADDVVQETLVRAWRNPAVLASGKWSARGWLFTVARTLAMERTPAQPTPQAAAGTSSAGTSLAQVMEALDQLSKEHRDILVEVFFRGSSVAEAAATLGIPSETVRCRSYHALRALRQRVGAAGVFQGAS